MRAWVAGVAALVGVLALIGTAGAAVTPAVPPAGAIDATGASVGFAGTVAGTVGSGAECAEALAAGTCSYFQLETVDAGLVEVSITWPAAGDPALESNVDLEVWECAPGCTQVAASAQDRGTTEAVRFEAAAGAMCEVRVVPVFAPAGGRATREPPGTSSAASRPPSWPVSASRSSGSTSRCRWTSTRRSTCSEAAGPRAVPGV